MDIITTSSTQLATLPKEVNTLFLMLDSNKEVLDRRSAILSFEKEMALAMEKAGQENQVDWYPTKHTFTPGVYIREISIPAGHIVVGKIHKQKHFNFISKGKVTVFTETGGLEVLEAPVSMVSDAGTKRVLFTHEDTVWSTVHPTESLDVGDIENEVIAKDYDEYSLVEAKEDYKNVLVETNTTHEILQKITNNLEDMDFSMEGFEDFSVEVSPIDGKGVFTNKGFKSGDILGIARHGKYRTILGRYVNHSPHPNAEYVVLENGDLSVVAIRDIKEREEVLYNYRQGAKIYFKALEQINKGI